MKKLLIILFLATLSLNAQDQLNATFSVENSVTLEDVPGVTIEVYRVYENDFEELIASTETSANGTASINTIITGVQTAAPISYGFTRGNTNLYFRSPKQTTAAYGIFDMATGERLEKGELDLYQGINRFELPNLTAGRRHIINLNINGKIFTQKYIGSSSIDKIKVSTLLSGAGSGLSKGSTEVVTMSDSIRLKFCFIKEGFNNLCNEMVYPQGDITDSYYVEFSKIPEEQSINFLFINTTSDPVTQPIYASWNTDKVQLENNEGVISQTLINFSNVPDNTIRVSFDKGEEYLHELMVRAVGSGFIEKNIVQNNGEKDDLGRPYVDIPVSALNDTLYVITTNKGGMLPEGRYLEFWSQEALELWAQRLTNGMNHKFSPSPNGNYIGEVVVFMDTENASQQDLDRMLTVFNQQTSVMNLNGNELVNFTEFKYINGPQDPLIQSWVQEYGSNYMYLNFKGAGGNYEGYNEDGSVRNLAVNMFTGASINQIASEFSEAMGLLDEPTGYGGSSTFVKDAPTNEFYKRLINQIYLKDNNTFRFNDTRMD